MKRIFFLFCSIFLFRTSAIRFFVDARKHRELPTRKVRHQKHNELKSSKSPKIKQGQSKGKSSKAPVENMSQKSSSKAPWTLQGGDDNRRSNEALYFMRMHAESLEDLNAILLGTDDEVQASTAAASNVPNAMNSVASTNSSDFDCINNSDFLTIDGLDCRWIDADDIRRQDYCLDPIVQSNCPQVCGKCCQDDINFSFNFTKDCEWLRNPNTDAIAVERQCSKQDVQTGCPVGCGLCDAINDLNCVDDPLFIVRTEVKDCAWLSTVSEERREKVCKKFFVQDSCQITCNMCRPNVTFQPSLVTTTSPSISPSNNVTELQVQVNIPTYQPSANPSTSLSPSSPDCDMPHRIPINDDINVCVDDPSYVAPFGGDCGCELFEGTDCNAWSALLDEQQLNEVWERCPVSCGVTCQ